MPRDACGRDGTGDLAEDGLLAAGPVAGVDGEAVAADAVASGDEFAPEDINAKTIGRIGAVAVWLTAGTGLADVRDAVAVGVRAVGAWALR